VTESNRPAQFTVGSIPALRIGAGVKGGAENRGGKGLSTDALAN